jgi:MFS family permease
LRNYRIQQYFQRITKLSPNAKLYMVATALQGLSSGIWAVIFNLYLNLKAVGFQPDFIGLMFTVSAIATGLVALPAGLLCERLGPKKALLIGFMANFVNLAQIVILQPSILLVASLSSGLIGTVAWVAAAPFMMENSTQEERTYFFSVDWAIMIIMGVIGNYVGGLMPNLLNTFLGLPTGANGSPIGYRISLGISMALALTMVIPVLLIKEDRMLQRQKISDLISFRNIRSHRTILKFMIPTAMIGFGAGFIVPLFNLFFSLKFSASLEQIGLISSLSSITLGIGTLAAPALSKRLGRVKSIAVCEFLSMPFIMLMTLAPNLALASSAFITRNALMNMAGPISSTLQMELVTETERATTNGLMVMADGVPRALTASVSGKMMTESDFFTPFLVTTLTYFVASSLYFMFFRKAETQIAKAGSENVR